MELPFFFHSNLSPQQTLILDEGNSKHVVQVLRMGKSERLNLTDGKGNLATGEIIDANKKKCQIRIIGSKFTPHLPRRITIAISLLKNTGRFEWFLEKATELGITEIIPLICSRTEKQHFRYDRMKNILISAMLQSEQVWLPELSEPVPFTLLLQSSTNSSRLSAEQKFIAHCIKEEKRNLNDLVNSNLSSQIILIGPEGDFTPEEVQLAIAHHFNAVSLGETRLRTETAGIVAATLLTIPE